MELSQIEAGLMIGFQFKSELMSLSQVQQHFLAVVKPEKQ